VTWPQAEPPLRVLVLLSGALPPGPVDRTGLIGRAKRPFNALSAARLRSEIGPVAADRYDEARAKELETKFRRQLARARAAERG
jgi:hypothetical protein